jgi:hypothetical protein
MTTPHTHLTLWRGAAIIASLASAGIILITLQPTGTASARTDLRTSATRLSAPHGQLSLEMVAAPPTAKPGPYRYGWPVKPFRVQHPVRGFFGDPRIANHEQCKQFHFGVDVSAPNGTPVYATLTGTAYVHPRHSRTVEIIGPSGVEFSYWHIVPTITSGRRVIAYETVIGHIEKPYGHVHFSERRDGRYLNPLRRGAMGPFADDTRPWMPVLRTQVDGRSVDPAAVGAFDLVVEAYDETPIAIPRPWHNLPVTPALVRWRVLDARGRTVLPWRTAADFRLTIPPVSAFAEVWAPATRQNHVRAPGIYQFILAHDLELRGGAYRVEVQARDLSENATLRSFELDTEQA